MNLYETGFEISSHRGADNITWHSSMMCSSLFLLIWGLLSGRA